MTVLELLIKQIDEKVEQLQDAVCSERISSFEEYKKLCGEIHGLLTARGYVLDVKDKMEQHNDE